MTRLHCTSTSFLLLTYFLAFGSLVRMYLYVFPNHHCRTVIEYTCIQLHMSLIQYPLAIIDGYVFL